MSAALIIVIVTVGISIMAFNNPALLYKLTMSPYAIGKKHEYWRFLTSGFVHGSWVHLGFNMFTLFFFGPAAEQIIHYYGGSTTDFVIFYLLAIVLSDLPTYFMNRDSMHYQSLGASGGVTAVVFLGILFNPLNKIYIYGIIGIPGFILGVLYLIYSINQAKKMSDNVNHMAHLTGAIAGVLYSVYLYPGVLIDFVQQIATFRIF